MTMTSTGSRVRRWALMIVIVAILVFGIVYALREFLTPAIR